MLNMTECLLREVACGMGVAAPCPCFPGHRNRERPHARPAEILMTTARSPSAPACWLMREKEHPGGSITPQGYCKEARTRAFMFRVVLPDFAWRSNFSSTQDAKGSLFSIEYRICSSLKYTTQEFECKNRKRPGRDLNPGQPAGF